MVEAQSADFARLIELLPWYVNGTLREADRAWIDAYFAAQPEAKAELAWYRTLSDEISARAQPVPVNVGWERVLQKVRQDRAQVESLPALPPIWQRALNWLAAPAEGMPRPRFAPAMLAMAGLIVLQSAALGWLAFKPQPAPYSQTRSGQKGWADGPLLRVNFASGAKESEIRLMLSEARTMIVAGPTTLGDYYLKAAPGKIDLAAIQLNSGALVQTIVKVPSLPPELLEE
jgi:anti-sigma factor RsiW